MAYDHLILSFSKSDLEGYNDDILSNNIAKFFILSEIIERGMSNT